MCGHNDEDSDNYLSGDSDSSMDNQDFDPPIDPFDQLPPEHQFESLSKKNGFRHWWASQLADVLGYESLQGFRKVIERAMVALISLNIPVSENIVVTPRNVDGKTVEDYKLSRFACYLAAMNGDPKKAKVAQLQKYFIEWAEACRLCLQEIDGVERVAIRGEISDHETILSKTAHDAGVVDFARFQNAGYRGLYNMDIWRVREIKKVPAGRSPLDFMGKTELAANLFRVTQTEEKIRKEKVKGQGALEKTAEQVGKRVREAMAEISDQRPEDLAPEEDIQIVRKKLKSSHREINKLDRESDSDKS